MAIAGDTGDPRPRAVLRDTIQPFPTFPEIFVPALLLFIPRCVIRWERGDAMKNLVSLWRS
jgi:hypothetical protein